MTNDRVPLAELLMRLQMSYRRGYDCALTGKFGPVERVGGRLFVSRAAADRVARAVKRDSEKVA